jgi:EAL domain-containing protein (putative c-di-GMP-specific phosphodiesterase class I)
VVEAKSGKIAVYECLMRVRRADGGIAHANEIVPVAERIGLVRMLDHRVLELVVNELSAAPDLHASVNVSPASTIDPDWWAGLGALLRANNSAAERLIIEITETSAIQDVDDARSFVNRVKDLGCRIAIDDFGAGHTSFRNLRKLGVDIVKIDGALARKMMKSSDDVLSCIRSSICRAGSASKPLPNGCKTNRPPLCCRNGASIICKAH